MYRAFLQQNYDVAPGSAPSVLVVGDTPHARARVRETIDAAGLNIRSELPPEAALSVLQNATALQAIWVELDHAPNLSGQRLLARLKEERHRIGAALIVSTRIEHIDDVLRDLGDAEAELLANATEADRLSSLALAGLRKAGVRDASSAASPGRLRQLSEEVSRIASALARLSSAAGVSPLSAAAMAPPREDVPNVSAEALRAMIRARRLRANYFPSDLFADPAWDMLLDLLQAELVQHRVPVSSLCLASAVPATTALRWIKSMTDESMLVRRNDPHDGRRVFIELAPETSAALRRYFEEVGLAAV